MTPVSPCLIKVSLKTMLRICILAATKESYPALSQATAPSAALHLTRYLQQLALPSPNVEWDIMHTARSVSSAMKLLTDLAVCMISHLTSSANRGKSVVGICQVLQDTRQISAALFLLPPIGVKQSLIESLTLTVILFCLSHQLRRYLCVHAWHSIGSIFQSKTQKVSKPNHSL